MPGPDILRNYNWDVAAGRYRREDTGRFVARNDVLRLLDRSMNEREARLAAGTQAMLEGRISPNTWLARSTDMMRRQVLQNQALAAGGWDRLTQRDYGRAGNVLRSMYARMRGTAADVTAGKCSLAQANARLNSYLGQAQHEYYVVERERKGEPKTGMVTLQRRHLDPGAKHCGDCVEYYERGWQPYGELPLPSEECECERYCKCDITDKDVPEAEAASWIGTKDGPAEEAAA